MVNTIKIGSDFSGVGAFNQALIRLGIKYNEVFACDMDKYARQTFELNYGKPKYFPTNVYDREIPKESLDIFMTSPPCQAFSLAGKRMGKEDKRGILFFNLLEFIQENKPRYFIFENVKGLLSHDKIDKNVVYGRTFQEWINYLGGKSVNGVHTFFTYEDSVPYHIYFQVLNAKHYGIPQNRERVFIIGIRDDEDNDFQFPKPFPLEKRLKDVLESEVDEKYFLGENTLNYFQRHLERHKEKGNGFGFKPQSENDNHSNSLTTKYGSRPSDTYLKIGTWRTHKEGKGFRATEDNNCPTINARAREDGSGQPVIKVSKEVRTEESKNTRKKTGTNSFIGKEIEFREQYFMNTITTSPTNDHFIIPANNSKGYDIAEEEEDSINFSNPNSETRRGRIGKKVSQTLDTQCNQGILTKQRIRRLTPRECFNLMDFNPEMIDKTIESKLISDSQLYKQAGNSICVGVLATIIEKLKL